MTIEERRELQNIISLALDGQSKRISDRLADRLEENDNKNHKSIYAKIEQRDKEITESMATLNDRLSGQLNEIKDEIKDDIGSIRMECVRREDVFRRGKAYLENPRQSPENFLNTMVGKAVISGVGLVGLAFIYKIFNL